MRLFLLLLGMTPLLALGLDLYFKDRAQERDARLVATANRLLIQATAPSQAARSVEIQRISEAEPGLWQVQGHITLEEAGEEQRSAYSIEIEQRCSDLQDDSCWQPRALVIGEERLLDESATPPAVAETAPPPAAPLEPATAPSQASPAETAVKADAVASPAAPMKRQADGARVTAIDAEPGTLDGGQRAAPAESTAGAAEPSAAPASSDSEDGDGQIAALETVEMSVEESLVWLIQDRLARLGYGEPGTLQASGALDAPTRAAIEAFQYAKGLPRDGEPSFELLDRIQAEAAAHGGDTAVRVVQRADEQQTAEKPPAQGFAVPAPAEPAPSASASAQSAAVGTAEPPSAQAPTVKAPVAASLEPAAETLQAAASEPATAARTEAKTETTAAAESAAPSWDTAGATSSNRTALTGLEQQVSPAAGGGTEAESDETLPDAQGDADLEPSELEPATSPAPVQQARLPQATEATAAPEPKAGEDGGSYDESLVFLIQDRLNRLGYDKPTPIKLDGKMDSRTRLAIFDYQQKNRLPKDGRPSNALLRHLEETLLGQRGSTVAGSE